MSPPKPMTFYIADLTDETYQTRAVDLQGDVFGVVDGTFDIGDVPRDISWIGNTVQARVTDGPTELSARLFLYPQPDTTEALAWVRRLNRALDQPGVIVWNVGGGAETEYADFYRSPLTRLFRAEDRNLRNVLALLMDPEGLPLRVLRHPARRLAIRESGVQLLANPALVEPGTGGVPRAWAWDEDTALANHTFVWTLEAYALLMGTPGVPSLGSTVSYRFEQVVNIGTQDGTAQWAFSFEAAVDWPLTSPELRAEVDFLDAGDVLVGVTATGETSTDVATPDQAEWTRRDVTAVAPAGSVKALCRVLVTLPSGTDAQTVFLRRAQFEQSALGPRPFRTGTALVSNDVTAVAGKRLWLYDEGNTEGIVQEEVFPESGANIEQIVIARRSGVVDVVEYAAVSAGRFVDGIAGTGAVAVSDAGATGGQALRVTHTPTPSKSVRIEIPSSALDGRHVLKVALKPSLDGAFRYQGRWGIGNVPALPFSGVRIDADTTDPPEAVYVAVPLMAVVVPHGVSGLYWELWSWSPTPGATTWLDSWWLEPAEHVTVVRIPGVRTGGGQAVSREWDGDELMTPPGSVGAFEDGTVLESGDYLLKPDSPDQAGGIPDTSGIDLGGVTHQFSAFLNTYNGDKAVRQLGKVVLHDVTADVEVASTKFMSVKGQRWHEVTVPLKYTPTVGGHLFYLYVVHTAGTDTNTHVRKLTDTYTPPISGSSDQGAGLYGATREAVVLQDEEMAGELDLDPPFPASAPGLQMQRISFGDALPNGWASVFPFEVFRHVADREATIRLGVIPRIK